MHRSVGTTFILTSSNCQVSSYFSVSSGNFGGVLAISVFIQLTDIEQ